MVLGLLVMYSVKSIIFTSRTILDYDFNETTTFHFFFLLECSLKQHFEICLFVLNDFWGSIRIKTKIL